jgi:hypothetical protein
MVYVPTPVHREESPRVRELSQRLAEVIMEYQRQYPMSGDEIRAALRLAATPSTGVAPQRVAAVVAALVAALLGAGLMFARAGGPESRFPVVLPMVILGGVVAALGIMLAVRRSR